MQKRLCETALSMCVTQPLSRVMQTRLPIHSVPTYVFVPTYVDSERFHGDLRYFNLTRVLVVSVAVSVPAVSKPKVRYADEQTLRHSSGTPTRRHCDIYNGKWFMSSGMAHFALKCDETNYACLASGGAVRTHTS